MLSLHDICPLNQELVIATADLEGNPHAIFVIGKGLVDEKILFGLCKTGKTYENLVTSQKIAIVIKNEKGYFRIKGTIELVKEGVILDQLLSLCTPPLPQLAVLVTVRDIVDLDKSLPVPL